MASLGLGLSKIAMSLVMSLLTEAFIKKLVVATLEYLVKKTASDVDDKVLAAVKSEWRL